MADEVPDGSAVFPEIPADLGVDPLLLAVLQAVVFLGGSDEEIVQPDAADEVLEYMASYLQRLTGTELERVRGDISTVVAHAKRNGWPTEVHEFLSTFLADFGVGDDETA
ncbi:MAG: hypothetical protein U0746_11465 [Gemmataceae bacterium]